MTASPSRKPSAKKGGSRSATKARAGNVRVAAVMAQAEKSGLLKAKDARITGRVSADLIRQAKTQTGLASDTELLEFALANIALEDNFVEVFRAVRGTVDPDIKLGY